MYFFTMNKRVTWLYCCLLAYITVSAQPMTVRSLQLLQPDTITCTPVKNQFMSGTCWSFSSMSLLESELMKNGKGMTDLSEMFIARYSMKRKIERHLALKGGNFFTPGGQFHDAIWVMKNYGLMPEEAYTGRGRGEQLHDHAEMDTLLSDQVKEWVQQGLTKPGVKENKLIDSLLDYFYGPVPAAFTYKDKSYTPVSFAKQYLGLNPDDFVEITSYTHHPFYKQFVLEDKYNWTGDAYWNVPLNDFILITHAALDNGYTVGWDGDADDPDFHFNNGLAYLRSTWPDDTKARQDAFENKITELDHMMHIVGRQEREGHTWYYIKNSWGNDSNPIGGFIWMRDDYFKMRTLAIIVNKKAIPTGIRRKMGW